MAAPSPQPVKPRAISLAKWFSRGSWALLDQALFAGSNFAVQVALARWMPLDDYGAFASGFAVFLFIGVFHSALFTEPMLVFGSGRWRGQLQPYMATLLRGHLGFAAVAALVLVFCGVVVDLSDQHLLAVALYTLAFTQALQLLPWMLRDTCYVVGNPRLSAFAGLCYMVTVAGGLFLLHHLDALGIVTALVTMAVASLVASVFILAVLRIRPWAPRAQRPAGVAAEHVRYGRWAIATGLTHYVPQNLPLVVMPWLLVNGYEASGALKALLNLTVPFVLSGWALSTLIVPVLVNRRHTPAFRHVSIVVGGGLALGTAAAWLLVAFFGGRVIELLYQERALELAPYALLLWPIGLIPLINGPASVLHSTLRAIERPERIAYAAAASSAVLIVVGLPLMIAFGLAGVIAGMVGAQAAQIVVLWLSNRHLLRAAVRPAAQGDDQPPHSGAAAEDTATLQLATVPGELDLPTAPAAIAHARPVDDLAHPTPLRPMPLNPLTPQPLVSVIMSNFNYARYLPAAVRSVLTQTYDHFELIVCDDGSTDHSAAVLDTLARRDERIRVIVQPNGGQASAWNAAFARARGDLIVFLDSDDRFAPGKLAALVDHFHARPAVGLSIHPLLVIDADDQPLQRIPYLTRFERGWLGERIVRRGGRWRYMPSSALALRREVADRLFPIPTQRFRLNADAYVFTVAPLLTEVDFLDQTLGEYRLHGGNGMSTATLDVPAARRWLSSVTDAVDGCNEFLAAHRIAARLQVEQNLNHHERRVVLAALEGVPGVWRRVPALLGAILADDLYGARQKLLAAPVFTLLALLPRRWRQGWATRTLALGATGQRKRRRGRREQAAALPVHGQEVMR